jgi:hypothetical protein
MCSEGDQVPGDMAEALRMLDAALDYINGPLPGGLPAGASGEAVAALCRVSGKLAAAKAQILSRFDATRAHDADGYGSSRSWLAARTRTTQRAAGAEVRRMRVLRRHPVIAQALARGEVSESWAAELADWTRRLPAGLREGGDKLLVDTAAAGANLEDLAIVARAAYEKWRSQQPDPDNPDDGFEDRYLKLGTTIDNAGRVTGNLTPECTTAVQAVLEALGKEGPEDNRTEPQRLHDALQLACELLIRAQMVPDRAGTDTRADVVIALSQLREMPVAPALEQAWLAALSGEHGYLAGKDAEAAACDAMITPVVVGHPDLSAVDKMIDILLAYLHTPEGDTDAEATRRHRALRYAIARLAIDLVSGPTGVAAILRRNLLEEPYNTKSVILDIGCSATIPAAIRRAVTLRARHCEWPGCRKPPAHCDVHHLRHKSDGGETSIRNCVLLCQFHHDICIHRRNWRLILHPDNTTTAYGPRGQVIQSHGPGGQGPPGQGPPGSRGPGGGQGPPGSQAA